MCCDAPSISRHPQLDMADYCPPEPVFASCFFLLKEFYTPHKLLAYREFFKFWCFLPNTVRSYVSKPEFNWKKVQLLFFILFIKKKKNIPKYPLEGREALDMSEHCSLSQ